MEVLDCSALTVTILLRKHYRQYIQNTIGRCGDLLDMPRDFLDMHIEPIGVSGMVRREAWVQRNGWLVQSEARWHSELWRAWITSLLQRFSRERAAECVSTTRVVAMEIPHRTVYILTGGCMYYWVFSFWLASSSICSVSSSQLLLRCSLTPSTSSTVTLVISCATSSFSWTVSLGYLYSKLALSAEFFSVKTWLFVIFLSLCGKRCIKMVPQMLKEGLDSRWRSLLIWRAWTAVLSAYGYRNTH